MTRFQAVSIFVIPMIAALSLSGCGSTEEFFSSGTDYKGPGGKKSQKDSEKSDSPDALPAPAPAAPPLSLKAFANGPVIQFSITNQSNRDLALKRDDFALVVPGGRRIVHYDSFTTNVEVSPWPELLRPGQTALGRAIFHEVSDPVGYRLIVNPRTGNRSDAAFTVIASPGAVALATSGLGIEPETNQ